MFKGLYQGKRVLITGHTGFKGSWLTLFLQNLKAELCGISLEPDTEHSHWEMLDHSGMDSHIADIRDRAGMKKIFQDFAPEIVFHLAAQPIVRYSYDIPAETFEINVIGTVNILEACRDCPSVRSIVVVTSDKCYENREQDTGYKEDDPVGGYDPYSASKGCAELVVNSYRRSFFNPDDHGIKHNILLATARAGNVIGGGDWAKDRLIPDLMRSAEKTETAVIRNPDSTRPFQHVLEPLSGYLQLGMELYLGNKVCASPWNFGPHGTGIISVGDAVGKLKNCYPEISFRICRPENQPHEAKLLALDCSKAEKLLGWHGVLSTDEMFEFTAEWYREFHNGNIISDRQMGKYIRLAAERKLSWTI